MRVLIHSPAFLPSVGGLEINTEVLARSLTELGDSVTVVTRTAAVREPQTSYMVLRNPEPREFLAWTRWAEVVLHQNLSLRGVWPLIFVRRPLVVSHHSWYRRVDGRTGIRDLLKRFVVRRASGSIAVSPALAAEVGGATVVVENGYRDSLFRHDPETPRDRELVFVGRLVSDKGADILLHALARLRHRGVKRRLTIVGGGPEREPLEALALQLGVSAQVTFAGQIIDEELAETYRRHEILVVPSRYDEPFGIVALEGIACGCIVVGSRGGGLPAAIGPCGLLFPNGDVEALADCLERLFAKPKLREQLRAEARVHLERHGSRIMVEGYRRVLASAVAGWRAP